MSDSKPIRTRALSSAARRAAVRRYNETAVSALCADRVTGEPCPGATTDEGPNPDKCQGIMAYVRYALRADAEGATVALAMGQCDLCRSVGHVMVPLDK